MKVKVAEATLQQIDWLVASREGVAEFFKGEVWITSGSVFSVSRRPFSPTTKWSQGGPIIERAGIDIKAPRPSWKKWCAFIPKWANGAGMYETNAQYGPSQLIAAMRCYVASQLGPEVEIPEELA